MIGILNITSAKYVKDATDASKISSITATIDDKTWSVPISLEKKNTFITGKKNEIIRLKENFNLILLIVYPNIVCSTQIIYKNNKTKSPNMHKTN